MIIIFIRKSDRKIIVKNQKSELQLKQKEHVQLIIFVVADHTYVANHQTINLNIWYKLFLK